jgi:hypothetical protein
MCHLIMGITNFFNSSSLNPSRIALQDSYFSSFLASLNQITPNTSCASILSRTHMVSIPLAVLCAATPSHNRSYDTSHFTSLQMIFQLSWSDKADVQSFPRALKSDGLASRKMVGSAGEACRNIGVGFRFKVLSISDVEVAEIVLGLHLSTNHSVQT